MAISTASANLARQKTYMINRNAGVFFALKGLFLHLAANKGNPDLQLVNVNSSLTGSDGTNADQVIADAACSIYAIYLKKRATATGVWFKASDHATVASATAGEVTQEGNTASQEHLLLYPNGWAQGTGFTIRQDTTAAGNTRSLLANGFDGFILLGA